MNAKQIIRQFLNDYYRYNQSNGTLNSKISIEELLKLQYDILSDNLFYRD